MESSKLVPLIQGIIEEAEKLIPYYMKSDEDKRVSQGNCAICVIDGEGMIYGKMYGSNVIRARESFRIAWIKASQVHITGYKTGEFEKLAFNKEIDEKSFGIERPDYIGWVGGQPLTLLDGTKLSVGFSGFRGVTDIEIVEKALATVEEK